MGSEDGWGLGSLLRMTFAFGLALPWVALLLFVRYVVRFPRALPSDGRSDSSAGWPTVSVVVPARNEAHNIGRCLETLGRSDYPDFEIIVVDDRSEDATADVARAIGPGRASRLEILSGLPLPDGWLGKPWACQQGAAVAKGDVLLFTDADTTHAPDLLGRAIRGLQEEGAHLLTLVGTQIMDTFWERLVQPHVFLGMLFRFPDFERVAANDRWRDSIANGQFIMMPREAYERVGRHECVRDEVVEDLALAQHVKRAGMRLRVRSAEDALSTRMYRSLGELVAGWSKNLIIGGQQSVPRWLRPSVAPLAVLGGLGLWVVPPVVLLWIAAGWLGIVGEASSAWLAWSAISVASSVALFAKFSVRMGAPARYGLLYPLGASVTTFIFLRSWIQGRNVRWKGRSYRVPATRRRP